jgi:2'-5' RNA ligase
MYAIISELDPKSSQYVSEIWMELCQACGLHAIYEVPIPHFSWLVAKEMDLVKTNAVLSQIAGNAKTFTLHTFGLGIFTGEYPILYLPLVKTIEMINLHNSIWDLIVPHCKNLQYYYSPKLWVPHITLALKDLTPENIACAVDSIAFDPIELYVNVENLAIAQNENERVGKILENYHLS